MNNRNIEVEAKLMQSEELFRFLIDNSCDILTILDKQGNILYISPSSERILGYKTDEFVGENGFLFVHPDDLSYLMDEFNKLITQSGIIYPIQYRMIHKDGSYRYLESIGNNLLHLPDSLGAIISTRDITERKYAEAQLELKYKFEDLIKSISSGLINSSIGEIDEKVNLALKSIGEFFEADRSFILIYSSEKMKPHYTYEWCSQGISSFQFSKNNNPNQSYPWLTNNIQQLEIINIPNVMELPNEYTFDKEFLEGLGVKSLIMVPLVYKESLIGSLGISTIKRESNWSNDVIQQMEILGEIFANTLVRYLALKEVKEQKEFAENLVDNSTAPTFVLDANHKVIIWNRTCEALTGLKASEMIGTDQQWKAFYNYKRQTLADLIIEGKLKDGASKYSTFEKSNLLPEGYHVEGWYDKFDGTKHFLVADAAPIRNRSGNLVAVIQSFQDITEHKRNEEKLINSEQILRAAFEQATFGIIHANLEGRFLRFNQKFCDIVGYSQKELSQLYIADLTHQDDMNKTLEFIEKILKEEIQTYAFEKRYIHKNGSIIWINLNVSLIRDELSNPKYLLGMIEDITQRKLYENAIIKSNKKLQRELEAAAKAQLQMLPSACLSNNKVRFGWQFKPSIFIAGDMFNFYQLDDEHISFFILDVMGHGISAALKAVTVNYLLKPSSEYHILKEGNKKYLELFSPAKTLNMLNGRFTEEGNEFFTIFYGVVNTRTLTMNYARAGHCLPLLLNKDENIMEIKEGGPAIGIDKQVSYKEYNIDLQSGDRIILYTDGITEAKDKNNQFFTKENLRKVLIDNYKLTITDLAEKIVENVQNHIGNNGYEDDLTMLGLEIL